MVAPALCIPCMTAVASTGPAAPLVIGASTIGAAGYYSLKKSKKKKKRNHSKKKKKKSAKTRKPNNKKNFKRTKHIKYKRKH